MKIAAIDIGTNSMRLLIGDVQNGMLGDREKWLYPTRMGEGMSEKGIPAHVMERNLTAYEEAVNLCRHRNVEQIFAFGTSALRDAANSGAFLSKALERTGVPVQIISGTLESELAYLGVTGTVDGKDLLILDVGGGSSEWVLVRDGVRMDGGSVNLGAVRLKENFYKEEDPPGEQTLERMEKHIRDLFASVWSTMNFSGLSLVGIGGTATTLSAMRQELRVYDTHRIQNSRVSKEDIRVLLQRLVSLRLEERKRLPGLQPSRADVIIGGVLIFLEVMEQVGAEELLVSDADNLEGAVLYLLQNPKRM